MGPPHPKKQKVVVDGMRGKTAAPTKKFKKQRHYTSDSDSDGGVEIPPTTDVRQIGKSDLKIRNLGNSDKDTQAGAERPQSASDVDMNASDYDHSDDSDITNASSTESNDSRPQSKKRKRNDPDAFANSISRILSSKLTTSKRADPILARSKTAALASQEMQDARLEARAKHKLREQKKADLDRGRVKDILGGSDGDISATVELEKRLRKTAQRGVVKLFNAVRAAQVKGEEAVREARKAGIVGEGRRKEKVNEMSKKGFLELIAGGGDTANPPQT
jgi:Rrp15p